MLALHTRASELESSLLFSVNDGVFLTEDGLLSGFHADSGFFAHREPADVSGGSSVDVRTWRIFDLFQHCINRAVGFTTNVR